MDYLGVFAILFRQTSLGESRDMDLKKAYENWQNHPDEFQAGKSFKQPLKKRTLQLWNRKLKAFENKKKNQDE